MIPLTVNRWQDSILPDGAHSSSLRLVSSLMGFSEFTPFLTVTQKRRTHTYTLSICLSICLSLSISHSPGPPDQEKGPPIPASNLLEGSSASVEPLSSRVCMGLWQVVKTMSMFITIFFLEIVLFHYIYFKVLSFRA